MKNYSDKFYEDLFPGSINSAKEIIPIINNLIKPQSVIDVGCGLGIWLSIFQQNGVKIIKGLDGEWVDKERLCIPKKSFTAVNLEKPLLVKDKFDLAICLEVAEHLTPERSAGLIKDLTRLSSVVLFSAAIPFQGGTNHRNENWPSYWIKLFADNNFTAIDCVRPIIWDNPRVMPWYAQNSLLFINQQYLKNKYLQKILKFKSWDGKSIVHPKTYYTYAPTYSLLDKLLPSSLRYFLRLVGLNKVNDKS